uniref:Uncharacterized protein n=1 Tax=Glossina palpalis gambiensis TaxID=67801 RepID=A0A1B0BYH8_9MUSC
MLSIPFVGCFIYLRLPNFSKFEEETHNDGAQWLLADTFVNWDQSKDTLVYNTTYVNVVEPKSMDNKPNATLMLEKVWLGRQGYTNHHNAIKLSLVTVANGNANVWLMTVVCTQRHYGLTFLHKYATEEYFSILGTKQQQK